MPGYSFGLRFSSSNAVSAVLAQEVQLGAPSWHTTGEEMILNEGMFADEGGYVSVLMVATPPPPREKLDLEIEVLTAQNIPLPDEGGDPKRFEPYQGGGLRQRPPPPPNADEIEGCTNKAKNKGTVNGSRRNRKCYSPPPQWQRQMTMGLS